MELLGADQIAASFGSAGSLVSMGGSLRRNAELTILKDALTDWLRSASPPPLGKLLLRNNLKSNSIFTHYSNFFCRGLPAIGKAIEQGKTPKIPAEAYAKLGELRPGWCVNCHFHHEHLTSKSSWSQLSGQKQLFVLGMVMKIREPLIEAIPYVIANPFPNLGRSTWGWITLEQ